MTPTQGLEPTQTRRPWRATLRTAIAVGIPAILLLPTIIQTIVDELGPNLPPRFTAWLLAAGVIITAVATTITRILAMPQVELLLRRLPAAAFAAQPTPKPAPKDPGEVGALDQATIALGCSVAAIVLVIAWIWWGNPR